MKRKPITIICKKCGKKKTYIPKHSADVRTFCSAKCYRSSFPWIDYSKRKPKDFT